MSSTPSVSTSDGWTKVGRDGRSVAFPPEAAAAFGRRGPRFSESSLPRSLRSERSERPGRVEFDSAAAAAFGRGPRGPLGERGERPERSSGFDTAASAAFGGGSRSREGPRSHGAPEFDAAALSAFGGGRGKRGDEGFPSAFGKKKSLFEEASAMGFEDAETGGYGMSALAKKRAEAARAPPPPKSYDELFPVLGAAKAPAAAPAPAQKVTAATGKPTFADLMRARAAEEEAEENRKSMAERERAEAARRERIEYEHIHRLHASRYSTANYVTHMDDDADGEDEQAVDYSHRDLDYDVYGEHKSSYTAAPTDEKVAESSSSDEDEESADAEEAW
jgi:hypothetical protein